MHRRNTPEVSPEILIVDEHPENLRLLGDILEHEGYIIRLLRRGSMTLSLVLDAPPNLIILGTMMPDMKGYEVCQQLKAEQCSRDIPVLFISALNGAAGKAKVFEVGGSDYITTPIQKAELLARVNTHLALSRLQGRLEEMAEERTAALQQEIADCKEIESTLRESEHKLLKSQQIAHLGSWEYDLKTGTFTSSPGYRRIFGIEPLETPVSYDVLLNKVHPKDRDAVRAEHRQAIQENCPYDGIFRIIRESDGEIRYLHARCEHITDGTGQVVRLIGILQDISDHERTKQQLEQERLRYQLLLDAYQDGVVITNQDFRVVEANRGFAEMMGYTRDEALTLHIWDWEAIHPESEIRATLETFVKENPVFETRHRRKDGTVFDVEVRTCDAKVGNENYRLAIIHDITERKRMKQALEKEMRRRKTLMAGYRDGIVMINISQDHRVVEANRRFAEMLGYTPQEVLDLHTWEWDAAMTASEIRASFPASVPSRSNLFETRHRRKDGAVFYVEVSSYRETVDGDVLALCICRDITERKRMEQQLENERLRYRTLIGVYHDGIAIMNQDQKVVEANRRFAEMLGYTPEEVLNLHTWDWETMMTEAELRANVPDGIPFSAVFETRHRRKDETVFDAEVSICGAKVGEEVLVFSICRDITERKRMEQALEKEMRQRKTLMAGYRDGIVILNLSQDHKVVEANRRFSDMLGYTPEEALDLHSWDWDTVMTEAEIRATFPVDRPNSKGNLFETRHRRKDGMVFDVEVSSYRETVDGEMLALCICRDITERKRIEEELRQHREHLEELVQARTAELTLANQQLHEEIAERTRVEEELRQAKDMAEHARQEAEAANRAKSEFLANMSHEIRTPLNAVLGNADLLGQHLTEPQQQRSLSAIKHGGHSLLVLINDILDLVKIETETLEIRPEPVNLNDFVPKVASMFQTEIAGKNLDLQIDIAPDLPHDLLLDRVRFRQILFNLLGNAVKFTEQGTVHVKIERLNIENSDDSEHSSPSRHSSVFDLHCAISDTGIGIPADQQQLIFDTFRQQDGQMTRKYGGTGLGLALTKKLVDIMGGTITVTSDVGKGSRFEVVLRQVPTWCAIPSESATRRPENEASEPLEAQSPASAGFIRSLLQELAPLVDEGDLDVLHYLERLRSLFSRTPFEEDFLLLKAQLLQYDFEEARTTLARLKRKLQAFEESQTL